MTKQPKLSYKTGKLYDKTQIICHTVWETVIQNLSYKIAKLYDKSETVRQNTNRLYDRLEKVNDKMGHLVTPIL